MFESVAALTANVRDDLQDNRFYSKQSWVVPARTRSGVKIHDTVIVGAGQCGLALAYQLKLRGVRRIQVIDAQGQDRPGPWSSFARMSNLRTPKSILGPDCGNPLLRFKTWFCSAYSREAYDAFEFIPLEHYREYLCWYRQVLDIETVNDTEVRHIEWCAAERCLRLGLESADGDSREVWARKVCLATGMTAAGRWAAPDSLIEGLPRESYFGAWERIPWSDLADTDVAVLGAGASGFDNASCAVDAGCRSVTVIGRRPFPKRDLYFELWRGRDDSQIFPEETGDRPADLLDPLLAHHSAMTDHDRRRLLASLFRHGRSPANPEYLERVRHLSKMRLLEGSPIDRVDYLPDTGRVRISGAGAALDVDRLILATGPRAGLEFRPELRRLVSNIKTWEVPADSVDAAAEELASYPKLSEHYQLQAKNGSDELGNIYSLADLIHCTVGLQSLPHVVTAVAAHIANSLYQEQTSENIALIADLVGT